MTRYLVRAREWSEGWELHVDGVGVTQVDALDGAHQQVRDLLVTVFDAAGDRDSAAAAQDARIDVIVEPVSV